MVDQYTYEVQTCNNITVYLLRVLLWQRLPLQEGTAVIYAPTGRHDLRALTQREGGEGQGGIRGDHDLQVGRWVQTKQQ